MPFRSQAQEKFFNVNKGKLERQGVDVNEWNRTSKGLKLPKRAKKRKSVPVREHFELAQGRFIVPKMDNFKK